MRCIIAGNVISKDYKIASGSHFNDFLVTMKKRIYSPRPEDKTADDPLWVFVSLRYWCGLPVGCEVFSLVLFCLNGFSLSTFNCKLLEVTDESDGSKFNHHLFPPSVVFFPNHDQLDWSRLKTGTKHWSLDWWFLYTERCLPPTYKSDMWCFLFWPVAISKLLVWQLQLRRQLLYSILLLFDILHL